MTLGYLKENGISGELVKRYKNSSWIESVGRGAYRLTGDNVTWEGALYTIQQQLRLTARPGGRTALELKGYGHYLSAETRMLYFFGLPGEYLPQWFKDYNWLSDYLYTTTNLFPHELELPLSEFKFRDFRLLISGPELAALEMLYHVPKNQGFGEAAHITESLTTLRPQIVQQLLENCNSIKVKRLFLYLAEKQNHSWLKDLEFSKINLGIGKRVIAKNGFLDKKYQITVPKEIHY